MKWSELFGAPLSNQQRQKTATAARDPCGERSIVKNEDVTPSTTPFSKANSPRKKEEDSTRTSVLLEGLLADRASG
jgi:hypothetical protein